MHLVIGATGGIGRATVKALYEKGEQVKVLVRDIEKASRYLEEFSGVEIVEGDAWSKADVNGAAEGVTSLFYCINVPYDKWEGAVKELLSVSIEAAVKNRCRLVFPGNVYVYGMAKYNPVDEDHPHHAHTKKGELRIEMENMLKEASEKEGLKYTIVRMPDFYGPYVINGFSEKLFIDSLRGKKMQWIGKPDVQIEYIYIEDGGKAMATAGLSEKGINEEFNVPAAEVTTNAEFLSKISAAGGKAAKYSLLNSPLIFKVAGLFSPLIREVNEMMYLKREKLLLDGRKFKNTFGFIPSTGYDEGIRITMDWVNEFYFNKP